MRIEQQGSRVIIHSGITQLWIDPWGRDSFRIRMTGEPEMDPHDWALNEPVEAVIHEITLEEIDTNDPW